MGALSITLKIDKNEFKDGKDCCGREVGTYTKLQLGGQKGDGRDRHWSVQKFLQKVCGNMDLKNKLELYTVTVIIANELYLWHDYC